MAFGLIGEKDEHTEMRNGASAYVESIHRWQDRAFDTIRGNIGYIDCFATHGFPWLLCDTGLRHTVQYPYQARL